MKKLLIADRAQKDLAQIGAHTSARWGEKQKKIYLENIRRKMWALRENPEIGVKRDDVAEGYRSLTSGSHQIYYRSKDDAVILLRVLHESMDVHWHIGEEQQRAFEALAKSTKSKKKSKDRDDDLSR